MTPRQLYQVQMKMFIGERNENTSWHFGQAGVPRQSPLFDWHLSNVAFAFELICVLLEELTLTEKCEIDNVAWQWLV